MNDRQGGRQQTALLCAVLFIIFSICYLCCFQYELLETAQWVLSDHQTSYMPVVSPLIIVSLLVALALGVGQVIKPRNSVHAFVYAPSAWLLALLTNFSLPVPDGHTNGWGLAGFLLSALATILLLWIVNAYTRNSMYAKQASLPLTITSNACIMAMLMGYITLASNTKIHLNVTLTMSEYAQKGDFGKLLEVGRHNAECSRSICAMRAFALSQEGKMGDKLFSYPQHHGAAGLIPPKADSAYIFDWPRALYSHLRTVCCDDVTNGTEAINYLRQALRLHPDSVQADYLLCAYLLERRLDDFARELPAHYAIDKTLPRHYKEALIVYQRRSSTPLLQYRDEETEANHTEFMKLKSKYKDAGEQEFQLVDMYPETYWCYYYFPTKQDK